MKNMKLICAAILVASGCLPHAATAESELGEVAIHQALLDLGTDLRLMCVAAHPDDEDSATLATYRKKWGYKTFALIATRGEGGQNEIGPELYEELGVIRTHEMMRASEITGAELHFLDMPEFGYSKSRDEAYSVWGEKETLRRMVRKIRELRPDVIITHHGPSGGHGHHQAVGATLIEAFSAAADPAIFPEQIKEGLEPWQASRLYRRSRGGGGGGVAETVIGDFDRARGKTYAEIAAEALREHESQGMGMFAGRFFGRTTSSYSLEEVPDSGPTGSAVSSPGGALFKGLPDRVSPKVREVSAGGRAQPGLVEKVAALVPDTQGHTREVTSRLLASLLGFQLRVSAKDLEVVPGQTLDIDVRFDDFGEPDASSVRIALTTAQWFNSSVPAAKSVSGDATESVRHTFSTTISEGAKSTIPHPAKLFEPNFLTPQFWVIASVDTKGTQVVIRQPVYVDIAPKISVAFSTGPYLIRAGKDKTATFDLLVTNHSPGAASGEVTISAPAGIELEQSTFPFEMASEGEQRFVPVKARLANNLRVSDLSITARVSGIDSEARTTARVVDLELPKDLHVGVIASYDDTFMTTLERFGIPHEEVTVADFTPEKLDRFSTIILDIRTYLVRPDVAANNQAILDYVERGGTVIVNYQKTFEWKDSYAPYPISVSHNRVTVEDAPIEVLVPEHPLFNSPNKIVESDWAGWRQERGLYFPNKWDDAYTPLILTKDPGENPPPGSCLIASYGKGTYLYTALGWYRQLRELHPGTLRVFANMLAL